MDTITLGSPGSMGKLLGPEGSGGSGGVGGGGALGVLSGPVIVPSDFSGNLYYESLAQNPQTRQAQEWMGGPQSTYSVNLTFHTQATNPEAIAREAMRELDRQLRAAM